MNLPCGHRVASCKSADIQAIGVQAIRIDPHQWHQEKSLFWLPKDTHSKLDELEIYHISDWEYLEKKFESALFQLAPIHFGVEQASKLMRWLASEYPEVAKELERILPVQRFADVMQRLLLERVSIRNIVRISEILIEWGQKERDPIVLVECVRNGISREIASAHCRNLVLSATLVDPSTEDRIRASIRQTAFGDFLSLESDYIEKIKDSLHDALKNSNEWEPQIILTAPDIRLHMRKLFGDKFDHIAVMSLPEVPPDFKVHVLGVISGESPSLSI
jgi:type III secretion protein V